MAFNPNELVLERIRAVEEYDPSTMELQGRYTQIEDLQPVHQYMQVHMLRICLS